MNTDEGEAETEAFKPPPKMSELNLPQQPPIPTMVQQQQQQHHQPPMGGMPPPFMGSVPAPEPVPSPMAAPMMNPGQQEAVDAASRVPTNNLQSNQFKLQRNRSESLGRILCGSEF